jgi:O-methyltransferase
VTPADRYLALLRDVLLGAHHAPDTPEARDHLDNGRGWVEPALTMVGRKRLLDLERCIRAVVDDAVPGDFAETGVWRGGACIYARACLAVIATKPCWKEAQADYGTMQCGRDYTCLDCATKEYTNDARKVWVCDSFRGLPEASADPREGGFFCRGDRLAVSADDVKRHFASLGLLDERVRFVEGWFRDSLPGPIEKLAVLRLDGDLYSSTRDALRALYPRLSPGGFCIVDDYGAVEPCRTAVDEYRSTHGITEPMEQVDWTCWRWRRGLAPAPAAG